VVFKGEIVIELAVMCYTIVLICPLSNIFP